MRQVWITRPGPPEVLQVKESPDPVAAEGQVRVSVRAAGINFADLVARTGMYQDAPPIPCVIGYEVSGVIDQLGQGVQGFSVGDRVLAMPKFGGYSDTVVLPANQVIRMPDKMSFEEGAALPVAYLTAHHMMLFVGNLRKGMRVLIHSAAGGVGLAALDIGRAHGCEIFGAASGTKHAFLKERGCQHPIDSGKDIPSQVRAILGKESGLDLVLDPIGGKSFSDSYNLLSETGRLVCFGVSSMSPGKSRSFLSALGMLIGTRRFSPLSLMMDNRSVQGVNMGHLFSRLDLLLPQFESLVAMYERGEIHPYVDRTFRFEEAAQAHHYLHDRKAKGKVLLVP
ncbi:MAG TPA: medium chain dehydrogenase/reductase family protein [Pseudomonadota bacterium]|jgi:NADPH:quinone reductase-like Zn-dependent oxidoreductase|nr:medium chain dehydrogenase/reductase family protein [Pseudomonadota bacterium]HNF97155.1 medium chain dehydrogenase/reductase family protein [Pseudomonadota bacterium]HNI58305.1 medium chain dehydrogenase/reductase family protein [Pseudomonadota bacterium]HNK43909.1 medium chain dehydrogenase/reductase family protein [Pseudomonadota bacterium]HNN50722.1 medium chain dehydrogenase/reductase family protein [Pseudomonadota bacterium]